MLAIIGGTGLSELQGFEQLEKIALKTPYARSKVRLARVGSGDKEFIFLPRHGAGHKLPPHEINYRANIAALSDLGVSEIVAVNAVGAIHGDLLPGTVAVPNQLIDYSYSRDVSFYDGKLKKVHHIDFSNPYSEPIRQRILRATEAVNSDSKTACEVMAGGTYACTQGPRLETAAEIRRLAQDGCDMVGMTGMPEASLARELEIEYASLALSVNWAAGLSEDPITLDDIHAVLESGMEFVSAVITEVVQQS
ncbi:MAG: 5'-methylthioadenosine phosphorylase [SAR86 cluster bacterium]|uniref:Probable 6-oxopurine nucleoside phosphorylase n=1 Tax=SAR86 cluster bacterium TaxID=2030880 RepID=A0A2A4X7B0_9GAMM|nr:MAG: 5'-methylthioadenosine phosphorylase [SAR86 cluster bacterium]